MSKKKQNSACDRPLRKGIKRPAQEKGSSRIESLRQELQANTVGSKEKTKVGQRNIKPIIIRSPASDWSERPKEKPARKTRKRKRRVSRLQEMHEQQADSWTNLKGKHAQGPGATSLYPAKTGHGGAMGQK